MHKRWGLSALVALAMLPTPVSLAQTEQEKKSRQKEKEAEQQPTEAEGESRRDRIRIRVLSDPMEISSFYRRSGGSTYPYYGGAYAPPPRPDSISQYYRSQETWVNPFFFYPGGYAGYPPYGGAFSPCHYGRRGLFDRAQRPGFFLEALPRGLCPCDGDGK